MEHRTVRKADPLVSPLRTFRGWHVLSLEVDVRERAPDRVNEGPSDAIGIGEEERLRGQQSRHIPSDQDACDFEAPTARAPEESHVTVDSEERVDLLSIGARDVLDMDGRAEDVHTSERFDAHGPPHPNPADAIGHYVVCDDKHDFEDLTFAFTE
jgi:hypothetical protein